jgi:betaine-aldehyde dehydrogenase
LGDTTVAEHRERQGMLGPLVCKSQYTKVMQHIATAKKEGAQLLVGGARPAKLSRGFFVAPTVFKVNAQHKLWKEEVFGPVLAAMTFKTEAEAIKLANDSQFGLGSAVISGDSERRQRVTRAFEAGIVWQNCSQPTLVEAPWGGVKKSGIGRELGTWGLENYLEVKQVSEYVSKDPFVWFVQPRAKL